MWFAFQLFTAIWSRQPSNQTYHILFSYMDIYDVESSPVAAPSEQSSVRTPLSNRTLTQSPADTPSSRSGSSRQESPTSRTTRKRPAEDMTQYAEYVARNVKLCPADRKNLLEFAVVSAIVSFARIIPDLVVSSAKSSRGSHSMQMFSRLSKSKKNCCQQIRCMSSLTASVYVAQTHAHGHADGVCVRDTLIASRSASSRFLALPPISRRRARLKC